MNRRSFFTTIFGGFLGIRFLRKGEKPKRKPIVITFQGSSVMAREEIDKMVAILEQRMIQNGLTAHWGGMP